MNKATRGIALILLMILLAIYHIVRAFGLIVKVLGKLAFSRPHPAKMEKPLMLRDRNPR